MILKANKHTQVDGEYVEKGKTLVIADEKAGSHEVKALLKAGVLTVVEEEKGKTEIDTGELTEIKGIGGFYAGKIRDLYGFWEKLADEDPSAVADEVNGIDEELAEKVIDRAVEMKE